MDEVGRDDERLCLKKEKDKWIVYYLERGILTTEKIFKQEEDACNYIFQTLIERK